MEMSNYKNVYQFKVVLKDIEPQIWRRILVPETYSLWDLHIAIQDCMGWQDCHLHQFTIKKPGSKVIFTIGLETDESEPVSDLLNHFLPDHKEPIKDWFTLKNNKAGYLYDCGDSWEHTIILEEIMSRQKGTRHPICTGGERACPPEDCGGPSGYEDLLEIMNNPRHPEYEETKIWLGGKKFDPDYFDPRAVKFDDPRARWLLATEDREIMM